MHDERLKNNWKVGNYTLYPKIEYKKKTVRKKKKHKTKQSKSKERKSSTSVLSHERTLSGDGSQMRLKSMVVKMPTGGTENQRY